MTTCPDGFVCFNKNLVIITIILIVSLIIFGTFNSQQHDLFSVKKNNTSNMDNYYYLDSNSHQEIPKESQCLNNTSLKENTRNYNEPRIYQQPRPLRSIDSTVTRPIQRDHKQFDYSCDLYDNQPPLRQIPNSINIPTRGYTTEFKQIGILHPKNKKNNSNLILPLYGKAIYPGSSKWQYYSQSDSHNSIKIDIKFQGKNCMDDHGCQELSEGDIVRIPAYAQPFRVNLYNIDKPTYIPFIV